MGTERAIDNGVNTMKSLIKDQRMVAGAGATEIYLADVIQKYAREQPGLDQYAVEKYGASFEIIPRTLAENAGLKVETILANLYKEAATSSRFGIDCSDVVVTILRVDQIIMSKPSGGPDMSKAARRPD